MENNTKNLTYLYCVTKRVPKLKKVEKLVTNLHFIYCCSLYAIVGKVSREEFDKESLKKNLADLEWVKTKAYVHEKVIEGIMEFGCVIPFKFATLFYSEHSLKLFLEEHAQMFKENLDRVEGKEEWGVKIYCNTEKLRANCLNEDKGLLKRDKEITTISAGKAYLLKKKKEELLNIAVNKKFNEYGQISFDRLREMSQEAGINKLLPKEVTERSDEMILNSAFLINKDKVGDFLNIVDDLRVEYTDKGLFFDCTGPWPPYNFCGLLKEKIHNG